MDTNASVTPPVLERLSTLGDATRCRILALLGDLELTVTEIRQALQLPQSTVSRHLRILSGSGWVSSRSDGPSHFYRMSPELDSGALDLWALVRDDLDQRPLARDRERASSAIEARVSPAQAFFSESAEAWDDLRDAMYGARADLLPLFGLLEPAWTVADLGAGTGTLARMIGPYVDRVIAVDRSQPMLEEAERRLAAPSPREVRIELRRGELERVPIESGRVDLAILSLVLHFVPDPRRVLSEARRILRPSGRVIVVDMRPHDRAEYREKMGHLWQGFSYSQMTAWLTGAGFDAVSVSPLRPDPEADGPLLFLATARAAREGRRGRRPEAARRARGIRQSEAEGGAG